MFWAIKKIIMHLRNYFCNLLYEGLFCCSLNGRGSRIQILEVINKLRSLQKQHNYNKSTNLNYYEINHFRATLVNTNDQQKYRLILETFSFVCLYRWKKSLKIPKGLSDSLYRRRTVSVNLF
jgi:hypothetical protein